MAGGFALLKQTNSAFYLLHVTAMNTDGRRGVQPNYYTVCAAAQSVHFTASGVELHWFAVGPVTMHYRNCNLLLMNDKCVVYCH